MKIVNLLGGLGNQMFEYAMSLALKNAHPEEIIKFCTRSFRGYEHHNGLEIDRVFGIRINEASLWDLCRVAYPIVNYKSWQLMHHYLPERKSMISGTTQVPFQFGDVTRDDSVFYDGYWQNEGFFKHIREQVLNAFSFPVFTDNENEQLARMLLIRNSVSVHIRRGDYLKEPIWCVCTDDYYRKGIDYLKTRDNVDFLCVFSDDIPWCRENLKELANEMDIAFVDWNRGKDSFRDMQLMSYCKHNIIANSTFSWWGGWLGRREGKIVVAPKVWCNKPIVNDPVCDNWIRL